MDGTEFVGCVDVSMCVCVLLCGMIPRSVATVDSSTSVSVSKQLRSWDNSVVVAGTDIAIVSFNWETEEDWSKEAMEELYRDSSRAQDKNCSPSLETRIKSGGERRARLTRELIQALDIASRIILD